MSNFRKKKNDEWVNSRLFYRGVLATGMLLSGTINTVSKKFQNDSCSVGLDGIMHQFTHPYFQTMVMFLGETLCLIGFLCIRFYRRYSARRRPYVPQNSGSGYGSIGIANGASDHSSSNFFAASTNRKSLDEEERRYSEGDSLLPADALVARQNERNENSSDPYTRGSIFHAVFILPMLCDLCGTTLGGIGLLYVSASIWQMLRGSVIIFSGILSVIFLKRKLGIHHWLGMLITFGGLVFVGASSLLAGSNDENDPRCGEAVVDDSEDDNGELLVAVGIVLILAGQLASATQYIIEERFLKDKNFVPIHVVGMEGFYGFLTMLFIVMPMLYFIPGNNYGSVDNMNDAFVQISNNGVLAFFVVLYCLSIAFYNFFGLSVAKSLSTVHRTLLDACRTLLVWGVDLLLYYAFKLYVYGESWNEWSWMEVLGFAVLLLGTFVYNSVIRIPFIPYPKRESEENQDELEETLLRSGSAGLLVDEDVLAEADNFYVDPDSDLDDYENETEDILQRRRMYGNGDMVDDDDFDMRDDDTGFDFTDGNLTPLDSPYQHSITDSR